MSTTRDLTYDLAYQYTNGVHTYGPCSTDGCNGHARGSLRCRACAATALAKATSPEFAARVVVLFKARQSIQGDIDDVYEEIANE